MFTEGKRSHGEKKSSSWLKLSRVFFLSLHPIPSCEDQKSFLKFFSPRLVFFPSPESDVKYAFSMLVRDLYFILFFKPCQIACDILARVLYIFFHVDLVLCDEMILLTFPPEARFDHRVPTGCDRSSRISSGFLIHAIRCVLASLYEGLSFHPSVRLSIGP